MIDSAPGVARPSPGANRGGEPDGEPGQDSSTLQDLRRGDARWATVGRRVVLIAMLATVVMAGLGLLGVHRRTVTVSGGGYTLTVLYAGVARPGLDVPLRVSVTSEHGFGKQITLGVDRRYLGIFESQGMFPDNSDATSLGADTVLLSYSPPPSGDLFVVDFDTYIQPGSQVGSTGSISVMDEDSKPVVTAHFSTFLFP